jgi:hypothetical protein
MANEFVVKNGLLVSGSANLSGSLVIQQVASDPALGNFLVLATDGTVKQRSSGATGAQGAQGAQGSTGAQGDTGAQGAQGAQGASAATAITNNVNDYVVQLQVMVLLHLMVKLIYNLMVIP